VKEAVVISLNKKETEMKQEKSLAIAFTGHRQLKGNYPPSKEWRTVFDTILYYIMELNNEYKELHFASGGALGFDQVAAEAVIRAQTLGANATLTFVIPFPGFQKRWPAKSQEHLEQLQQMATKVVFVDNDPTYKPYKLQKRNEYMVNRSDMILALIEQGLTKGGTFNCIKYAYSLGDTKTIMCINPNAWEGNGLHPIHPFPIYWR
jgi:uncharacterized phage-like protein YoqJ